MSGQDWFFAAAIVFIVFGGPTIGLLLWKYDNRKRGTR